MIAETDTLVAEPPSHDIDDIDELDESLPVDELLEDELLVEEISIDGMCGVY